MDGETLETPTSFYYYTSVEGDDRKRWFEETILDRKIYFRSREQLNDPNELRPSIVIAGTDKEIRNFVRELIRNYYPKKLSPAKRLAEETRLIRRYKASPQMLEETLHSMLDRIGVFCLSVSPVEPLLWAHYANGSRGVVIEFEPSSGLFMAAQRVHYTDDVPIINRLKDSRDEILEKSMFTKTTHWGYEREWRIIARWKDEQLIEQHIQQHGIPEKLHDFMNSQDGPGVYSIPPEAIKSVILGARIAAADEEWVRSLVEKSASNIRIEKASISQDRKVVVDA